MTCKKGGGGGVKLAMLWIYGMRCNHSATKVWQPGHTFDRPQRNIVTQNAALANQIHASAHSL